MSVFASPSGQVTEAYVLLRACLENSLYSFYVTTDPQLPAIWSVREDNDGAKKKCRDTFTVRKIFDEVKKQAPQVKADAHREYELCIDRGGHPNKHSVSPNLKVSDDGLHDDLLIFNNTEGIVPLSILSILRVVDAVFQIEALAFPGVFTQPNLSVRITNWRKDYGSLTADVRRRLSDASQNPAVP